MPQGGPISCVLSNVDLHYVLDLWFEKRIKPACRGGTYLVRLVDDFVGCFQYKEDADRFGAQLRERFSKFHIELAEEKTQRIMFGRFAKERLAGTGRMLLEGPLRCTPCSRVRGCSRRGPRHP